MELIIASNNAHKVREIREILGSGFEKLYSLDDAGIKVDVVEDGETFLENALKKAREVLAASDADAALSDDSGLVVDALNGAPGVHSARYAGEGHDDDANNKKLLLAMHDVPENLRTCRFISAVAIVMRDGREFTAQGACEGKLLWTPLGENGFGYDPLFYYEPLKLSFAEMNSDQKNLISHRRRALESLSDMLRSAM